MEDLAGRAATSRGRVEGGPRDADRVTPLSSLYTPAEKQNERRETSLVKLYPVIL